jgi:hypothetical protein
LVCGTFAQHKLNRGTTFYNFGNTAPYPPAPTPQPPVSVCGGCGTQDMLIEWQPPSVDLNELMIYRYNVDFANWEAQPAYTTVCFNQTTHSSLYYIEKYEYVQSINFPNLKHANQIMILDCPALISVDLSALESATGITYKSYYTSFPNIGIDIGNFCPLLTDIRLGSSFTPSNGKKYYFNSMIPQSQIDQILAIFEAAVSFTSGELSVYGDGPPSASGYASKAAIQARGVTVFTA